MKKILLVFVLTLSTINVTIGQNKNNKIGTTVGFYNQQYNGNLGNSFFKFNTVCFGGVSASISKYLTNSFDLGIGASIGDFGYCQTEADKNRIVSFSQRCPGCIDKLGMGELRSRMISGNIGITYKFANDYLLKEYSKLAPYINVGIGVNQLSDNMKRNCVNAGNHFTINASAGIKYCVNERFNIGYNMGFGCFVFKKVYYSNAIANDKDSDADDIQIEKRRDFYMQNTLFVGLNF